MPLLAAADYQPALQALFDRSAAALQRLLPEARGEHVGASSIPGACSKGDLDICVIVAPERHAEVVALLCGQGFGIKKDTLRREPALVAAYESVKRAHWGQGEDAYRAAKARFIESVLARPGDCL